MMRRERWQQIQSLFEELVDVEAAERATRLAGACAHDLDLRRSVESLFATDGGPEDPLVQAIGDAARSLLEQHRDRLLGTRIGPFLLDSILGHGGMSTVYRAERVDGRYQQTVAIKVLHHTMLHPRLRSRLHSERHILGTLDHPCIARLIDSGELEDGTPYLVMEHVDGDWIDAYCERRNLSIGGRIELMIQACAAVQYAHRNLIVHRDIKASNILVTGDGTPKLLDFGIAKLLAPESMAHTVPVTRLHERILTPENAAPEQVLGRPLTTATDVYALGVLLYQLLSGRSPFRLLSYSQLQLERAICMDDPVRPSQAAAAQLRTRLSGDLDAIVAMAMRKEPDRRYASAEALADDLRNHLLGKPVAARHGDWRYKGAKFMRRHALAVGVATAVFVGLIAIAAATLWQNHRIEMARDATARERDRAQLVSAFLVDVFSQSDPYKARNRDSTAKDLLDQGAEKIQKNTTLQPEVRAELLESIGLAYRRQGFSGRAIPLFEQALAIRRDERPADNLRVAAALANLASALSDDGNVVSAQAYLQQALAISRRGNGPDSVVTAEILMQFGHLALDTESQPQRGIQLFREALAIYRNAAGDHSFMVAATLNDLASAAVWSDDFAGAEAYEREALRIFQEGAGRNHPEYAMALSTLGHILTERGKYSEAEQMLKAALEVEYNVYGAGNPRVAETEAQLGVLYGRSGDIARGIAASEMAVKISMDRLGTGNYLTGYHLVSLADLYMKAGNLAAAERAVRQALGVYAGTLPARHLYVASARQLLGEILLRRGELAAAMIELRAAEELCSALAGADSWRTARARASLGWSLIAAGNAQDGEPLLTAARERLVSSLGPSDPASQLASARLADYYRSRHRDAEAARISGASAAR